MGNDVPGAIAWANNQIRSGPSWPNRCLSFVAHAYGYDASTSWPKGEPHDAYHFWVDHAIDKHPHDMNPPGGALVFWRIGPNEPGHVALADGMGNIYTTHRFNGKVSKMSLDKANQQLGGYLGWSAPAFQGNPAPTTFNDNSGAGLDPTTWTPAPDSGVTHNPDGSTTTQGIDWSKIWDPLGVLDSIKTTNSMVDTVKGIFTKMIWLFLPSSWIRIQAGIAGFVLLILGLVFIAKEGTAS
jgi:hypothetical protein